ncbi:hypothetical protein [Streptomyces sp. DB-54]
MSHISSRPLPDQRLSSAFAEPAA